MPGGANFTLPGVPAYPPSNLGHLGYFWSTTSITLTYASTFFLRWDDGSILLGQNPKGYNYSVRLLKEPVSPTTTTTTTMNPLVTICGQTWMTKNLDVAKYQNNDPIPQATTPIEWLAYNSINKGCWAYPDFNPANASYGKLYNAYAVTDSRGLIPGGYHIPSENEFQTLISCLGGPSLAGGALKETGIARWDIPNLGATNSSGFTGVGSGIINNFNGEAFAFKAASYFLTTDVPFSDYVRIMGIYTSSASSSVSNINKDSGLSIRLIKD